ncbi:threonine--tRNA ligase [Candidatus Uhrbacteria bacterium]|nr:threonine--tRNA ligase [Candidatus Uhrbacteria bacterium]
MSQEHLDHLRHSCAHLLAAAVKQLWPHAKRTIGPSIEDGFYFDFDFGETKISEEDFPAIEAKMREILPTWSGFTREEVTADQAKQAFADNPYKSEMIDEFSSGGQTLTLYHSGDYFDLCRGGHCEHPKEELQHFKLLSVAGAYWRGDEKNQMLTRIYGTCFPTKEELEAYIIQTEEAKKRDHRKLGKQLGLFTFSALVGSGLPLFTSKGTELRRLLGEFVWSLMRPHGYERVWIPHLAKSDLYRTSGHWDKFSDDIFHVSSKKTDEEFVLKPMNCPHHTQIYASEPRSYRDLPIRMSEITTVYRDENTGQLQGLSRVRSITQDDAHIFCTFEQVKDEAMKIYDIIEKFYGAFEMPLSIRLSMHDPDHMEKYLGSSELWGQAVETLKSLLDELGKTYEEGMGEAAFYGPKIDFVARDAIGRRWQLATIQLDFNQPERFGLEYTDADGSKKRPVMIHRAISGSIERFISVLIEHYEGAFPFWLAPVQVRIATVSDEGLAFARARKAELEQAGVRVELDDSNEKVGKKIRDSAMSKIPWTIVVGQKEMEGGAFKVNVFGQEEDLIIEQKELVQKAVESSQFPA